MQKVGLGLLLIGFLAFEGRALAAETTPPPSPEKETPSELFKDATRGILRALGLILQSVPQYEAPEILDNGDIIIRRKHTKPEPGDKPKPDAPAKTKT
ncbi:MAG: hypothetical protein O3A85_12930 [Proteobacteria bacterium]|nr:hypothetical protein [Pseudomonadota bacterium]